MTHVRMTAAAVPQITNFSLVGSRARMVRVYSQPAALLSFEI
jgi:hypothetical protein